VAGNEHLAVEKDGHVVTVTMDRPEARNAWSAQMIAGFIEAWDLIDGDDEVRVAILTGAGGNFCAGADLKAMSRARSQDDGDDGFADRVGTAFVAFDAMLRNRRLTKPLIAAVEGYAVAGGTEILQATQIRVAGESARFGLAEVKRSLFPTGGSTVRLVRQIPYTRAMEILLIGDHLSAREARDIGLIGRVVPDGQALAEARTIAEQIARNGPVAVRNILASVHATMGIADESEALARELEHAMVVFGSEDAKEGPRAFAEKREPTYRGA
jgi:enoyl-CoA hydratase